MHKKLGPLEAWQWALIAAGLLLVYYEYEKSKANSAATTTTGTTTTDNTGPIDPTTGLPYADEIGTGAGISGTGGGGSTGDLGSLGSSTGSSTDGATSLQQELSDLGSIEGLMSNLGLGTGGSTTNTTVAGGLSGSQTKTLNTDLTNLNKTISKDQGAISKLQKQVAKLTAPKKTSKPANHKNPGHQVTTHPGGKKTPTSSAPHNGQQHTNIAPPSHQRATQKPAAPKPKPRPKPTRAGGHR